MKNSGFYPIRKRLSFHWLFHHTLYHFVNRLDYPDSRTEYARFYSVILTKLKFNVNNYLDKNLFANSFPSSTPN